MIGIRTARLAVALLLAAAPVAASAQAVTDIKFGQTLTKKAGTKVDLYRFVGGSGTTIKATLTAPGKAALILYTPAGEEMLTAQGNGTVTLEAILPLWDVFFIGVVRKNPAQPHSLKLTGVEPDDNFAEFAGWVGYSHKYSNGVIETQCWLDPGRQIRVTRSDGEVQVGTIGRGGKTYYAGTKNGKSAKWEILRSVEGDEVVEVKTNANGRTDTRRYPLDGNIRKPNGGFLSYLCV